MTKKKDHESINFREEKTESLPLRQIEIDRSISGTISSSSVRFGEKLSTFPFECDFLIDDRVLIHSTRCYARGVPAGKRRVIQHVFAQRHRPWYYLFLRPTVYPANTRE